MFRPLCEYSAVATLFGSQKGAFKVRKQEEEI
jgi:hypothetical protein